MSRRNWIKLYVDHCLRGSWFDELTDPAERFVWVGLLLLAGDSALDGKICLTDRLGYTDEQIAALLKIEPDLFLSAKEKMRHFDKIRVLDGNIILISNWTKYQSEYQRQKHFRSPKVTPESDSENSSLDRDRDREVDKKKKKTKRSGRVEDDFGPMFEKLWSSWPPEGRFKKQHCLVKFTALCKSGRLDDFRAVHRGYLKFLEYKENVEHFKQRPMHLATFLNNWEGDKEQYKGFEYTNW